MSKESDAAAKPFAETEMPDAGIAPGAANDVAGNGESAKIAELTAQVGALKDQLLRSMAEVDNVRKRADKEREDTAKYAVSGFAKDLLPVADNLRRALDAVPAPAAQSDAIKSLVAGVEATERQLLAALDRVGIRRMQPQGTPFDPNFHRVMQEVETPDHAPGTVMHVMQAGYMIHDRLLREAMVVVAKNGAASAAKAEGHVDTSV